MPTEYENRFDCENLLRLENADAPKGTAVIVEDDQDVVLQWNVASGAGPECVAWLKANRLVASDFDTKFRNFAGTWRTTAIKVEDKGGRDGTIISVTMAKGYYTALDWNAARVVESTATIGNTSAARDTGGVALANTSSANPRNIMLVRLPYIAPASANAIALAVVALNTLDFSSNPVQGISTGTYRVINAAVNREDDLYCSIIVTLALPQFTLEAYTDFGGLDQATVVYLWRVPEALSQGIITAWRTAHPVSSSASADYQDGGLVNIILRRKANTPENLSIEGINLTCDTVANYHFAWGYAESAIAAFITAHNTTPTGASYGMAGVTREVSVQTRGDGLFDIIIRESIRTFDESKHVVFLTTYTGSAITQQQQWGWYLPMSELSNYKNEYDAANKVVNQKSEFTVSRHDDCTFDYRGVVEVYTEIEMSAATSGSEGVAVQVDAAKYVDPSLLAAAMPASAKRKRVQIILEPNDLGSASYTVIQNTAKQTADEQVTDGGRKLYQHFKNADAQPATPGASYRIRGISVGANDDETLDGSVLWQDTTELAGEKDFGNGRKLYYGQWASSIPDGQPSEKFQQGSVNIDDDGKYQYNLWFKSTQDAQSATWEDGVALFARSNTSKVNDDPVNVPTPGATDGISEDIDVQIDPEDGTARWKRASVEAVDSGVVGGGVMRSNGFVKETLEKRRNAAIADLPTIADGVRGEVEFEILETKRLNYIKKTLEMNSSLGTVRTSTERERIVYDADYKFHNSSVSARYTDSTSGQGWETKITTFLMADVPITRKRFEWTTIVEEYSLAPFTAESVVSPDGGMGGEQTSVVDIVGDGLWRRTKTTVEFGEWTPVNSFITWTPFAADLIETSTT